MRTQLNGSSGPFGQELRLCDVSSFALYVYTDGSDRDETRTQKCAGWGFTAMTKRPRCGDKPMIEACGPAQITKGEEFYIGATRATNNTAKMQGVIEVLFWLNFSKLMTVNSHYVKGLIEEKFTARENRVLATLLGHMWKVTKQRLRLYIRWMRGHSGDVGNGIAGRLADEAHAMSSSTDGGDGAHCVDGMKRASSRKL